MSAALMYPPPKWVAPYPWSTVFDPHYYWARYGNEISKDLSVGGAIEPSVLFEHFKTEGIKHAWDGSPNWSLNAYWYRYPDLQAAFPTGADNWNLMNHWLTTGINEGRSGAPEGSQVVTPVFDPGPVHPLTPAMVPPPAKNFTIPLIAVGAGLYLLSRMGKD